MPRKTTGIDIGARSVKLIRGEFKGGTFHVTDFAVEPNAGGTVERGWQGLELDFKPLAGRIGLTGREVNLRYTRVPRVPDWQLRKLMRFEVDEIGDQSGAQVASDFNLLPEMAEVEGEDIVLLAMAREALLETHMQGLAAAGGTLDAFSPNALALYNAWLRYGAIEGDTVLLANIGRDNLDVIICRGPDLVFARNLSGGARIFDDAIAERFGVSATKAEEVKIQFATLEPGARHQNANQEKASRAILGAAGQLASLLQATLAFCKSQLKLPGLKLDRVLLCGGGAKLAGLPAWLRSTMGVPVELFDPFRVVETQGLDPESADLLEKHRLEAVVALGLATMASDPEAYSVEILPAAVRKKREFWGGTAWLVAAAVLAALFLGWDAWKSSQDLAATEAVALSMGRRLREADRTDRETRELLEENAALRARALDLQALLGSGEQLARTLDVLQEKLPDELWLSHLSSGWSFDPELGVQRELHRPIVSLKGRARQGTRSLASIFETFLGDLDRGLAGAAIKAAPSPDGTSFAIDLSMLAPNSITPDEITADDTAADDDEAGS